MAAQTSRLTVEQLLKNIADEYEGLSKQLKVIARHIERHQDQLGLEGIQQVADQCEVQPSAVVRFAKHFGFSGFAEMQRIFREQLTQQVAPNQNYQARVREAIESGAYALSSVDIARDFLTGSIAGMQDLRNSLPPDSFRKAVDLLAEAQAVWIVGARRSFPIAAYLDYALQHTDKRVGLISGLGAMQQGQLRSVREGEVIIAISFAPYASETLEVVQAAVARGARLVAITDSRMSPLARDAQAILIVQENSSFGFRSLTNTMGLAQSLFVALAFQLELPYQN